MIKTSYKDFLEKNSEMTYSNVLHRIYSHVWVDFSSVRIFCKSVNSQMRRLIKHEK
ncbi:hypothetical protein [Ruminococcus flavefaciens]|uniref:hypothetical protein n=1 Tax=Ruminococcus flavefaciens TaxID=1265 RepID=UPI0026EA1F75|nr:hypothetical protein [Ruminococcus flavefaciens]MDD7517899.1 hypothetical protein [Ruminococcus flavefaciens]MDY5691886.1 hypothetical protein [Ruminococcus flavefaciens]